MKGYKVTDATRKHKVGIAASSLEDLKIKTYKKFENEWIISKNIYFQLIDGTKVDTEEYFSTLPSQTTLIWVEEGKNAETDAERLYKIIREVNLEYLSAGEKVQEFFTQELKNKVFEFAKIIKESESNKAHLSKKEDHPEWFEGLDTRSKTKEEYMFRRAQDRIRGYYYKAKDDLSKQKSETIELLLKYLQTQLKQFEYFGCYFDRRYFKNTDSKLKCICDANGTFICQGRWNKEHCLYEPKHTINPYRSRENRLVFQTWNLDHRIEKSRVIIPLVITLNDTNAEIDFRRVFRDLFTTDNLKLVHIICHDKGKHITAVANYQCVNGTEK